MKNQFFFFTLLFLCSNVIAQDLEVTGSVKVNSMTLDNEVDSVVVRMSDGTLGLRDVSSLSQFSVKPSIAGSLGIGTAPFSLSVSGRYAYIVDLNSDDLKIIDVSNPSLPMLTGTLTIGFGPRALYVSGHYAYVVDQGSDDLKVIDVSNPSTPALAGSLGIGPYPVSVYVSGRYAYVVDQDSNDLKIIDVSDPSSPALAGSLGIGGSPVSVFVSGRYTYVVDQDSDDLKIIDVSDPSFPALAGSLGIGGSPVSVYVTGRYAYVVDPMSQDLKIIDVSDPSSPALAGSLGSVFFSYSVFVSGRYAYVVDQGLNELKIIDVSDPSAPVLSGRLGIEINPSRVFVSGRYAYVITASGELKIIDISGGEYTSLMAHSLEAGNLQVRNDIIVQGQVQITGGLNVGSGGIYSDGDAGITGSVTIGGSVDITGGINIDSGNVHANGDVDITGTLNIMDSVGIGNNSPQEALHVTGKLRVDGTQLFLQEGNQNISLNTAPGSGYVQLDVGGSGHTNDHIILGHAGAQHNNIGIGTITPNDALDVVGDIDATGCIQTDDTGTIGGTCLSDQRLKKNIRPLESQLNILLALRPVTYDWKDAPLHNSHPSEIGLVAQEVEAFIPEMVINSEDDYKRIRYDISLQLRMVKAMQEQQVMIEKQQRQFEKQSAIIEILKQTVQNHQLQIDKLKSLVLLKMHEDR